MKTQNQAVVRVKELFQTEESHYHVFYEKCLPNEIESNILRAHTLCNTLSSEWPDDSLFENELNDRLAHNFRENIIQKLSTQALDIPARQNFLSSQGKDIAIMSFQQVKEEYEKEKNARQYWGQKIGYFS